MSDVLLLVLAYDCLVVLVYLLCWRLVRGVDTRLPIAQTTTGEAAMRMEFASPGHGRQAPGMVWQIISFLLGIAVIAGVALLISAQLSDLRAKLGLYDQTTNAPTLSATLVGLLLPVGQLAVLVVLYFQLRRSVLFPAVAVHLFLLALCLLVTAINPGRLETSQLTLVPIFLTNLVLLLLTHSLLTLLFCRSHLELAGSLVVAAVGGAILALGTTVIALVSTLLGGPLFFFQLYLISAFGIFGLYFCQLSVILSIRARD